MRIALGDPSGRYGLGQQVTDQDGEVLDGRGGMSIPVDSDLLQRGACTGLMVAPIWRQLPSVPGSVCPLALYLLRSHGTVHWRARLRLDQKGPGSYAELVLDNDSTQPGALLATLPHATSRVAKVQPGQQPDQAGGWWVGGSVKTAAMCEGLLGMRVRGFGEGISVELVAVSQT